MQAHQELSVAVGIITSTSTQIASTPLAEVVTQEEEKGQTQDKEESTIQTLVELPKIGTSTKTV